MASRLPVYLYSYWEVRAHCLTDLLASSRMIIGTYLYGIRASGSSHDTIQDSTVQYENTTQHRTKQHLKITRIPERDFADHGHSAGSRHGIKSVPWHWQAHRPDPITIGRTSLFSPHNYNGKYSTGGYWPFGIEYWDRDYYLLILIYVKFSFCQDFANRNFAKSGEMSNITRFRLSSMRL